MAGLSIDDVMDGAVEAAYDALVRLIDDNTYLGSMADARQVANQIAARAFELAVAHNEDRHPESESTFKTGDRVYQARVGTVFMDQVFGGKPHTGVLWEGHEAVEYAEPETLTPLNDLSRFVLETVAEDATILAEICPSLPDDDISCPHCAYRDEARNFWPD